MISLFSLVYSNVNTKYFGAINGQWTMPD